MSAAWEGHLPLARLLTEKEADVNIRDYEEKTAPLGPVK